MKRETELGVVGMTCPSCVRHVKGALAGLPGVEDVEVRLRDGVVVVRHDEAGAGVAALVEALRGAGYEAAPVAAEAEAR